MDLFVGLDVGTQGTKAIVYDPASRRVVSRGSQPYDILPSQVQGRAEQHPSTWIQGGTAALSAALSDVDRKNVRAMGISGQQHGFVPLDEHGAVIRNAKLWCDLESADEAAELSESFGENLVPSFTASKIMWLKRNEPKSYARLRQVLLPHDYFNYHLTGRYAMECGDASGTGLFDVQQRRFNLDRMALIDPDLHSYFPDLIGPNEMVGKLRPEVARELGLSPDVGVAPGSGDNAMSALGAGAVTPGTWVLSLGTSGTLFGVASQPVTDPSGVIAPFCDATGQWLPLLCTMNCTTVTEEVRHAFGMDHETLTKLAEAEPPGCSGVNYLPYITGERTPNWPHATGALLGLTPGATRPGLLYRAALEGATFSLLAGLRRMQQQGLTATGVRVVGGGSKNRLWRSIIADAFQLPLEFPLEPESAALGAALQAAAVHCGIPVAEYVAQQQPEMEDEVVAPNPANRAAYAEAFDRHQRLSELLFGNSA